MGVDWIQQVTEGRTMRLTCERCGEDHKIEAVGGGKQMSFPGWLKFYRDHEKCPADALRPNNGGQDRKARK